MVKAGCALRAMQKGFTAKKRRARTVPVFLRERKREENFKTLSFAFFFA